MITNNNGVLTCEEPLPENAAGLPAGSFAGSCFGCSVAADTLTCTACLDGAKQRHTSSIPVAGCSSIGNDQGALKCDDAAPVADDSSAAAEQTEL